jgi:cell fate (sporulation/competence/biofilm development) regulator YlbF (YheA/YmcA/DUF963 family)
MLEDKAKDLGRTLGQSSEYQTMKRTAEALNGDADAVATLTAIEQLRMTAQKQMEEGERPTEEMERQLDALLTKVQGNSNYQRAIASQENFDKLMVQVNQWISDGIRSGAASPIIMLG